jgi:hypothetical protein
MIVQIIVEKQVIEASPFIVVDFIPDGDIDFRPCPLLGVGMIEIYTPNRELIPVDGLHGCCHIGRHLVADLYGYRVCHYAL